MELNLQHNTPSTQTEIGIAPANKLRFAIMCNGMVFPEWQARCIREIVSRGLGQPVLLIRDPTPPSTAKPPLHRRIRSRRFAWNLYSRLFVRNRSRAIRPVDLSGTLSGVPEIACTARKGDGIGQFFDPADIARIVEFQPDFILRFAFNIIRGKILECTPYGVWSFHHDDLEEYRGQPACFWPSYFRNPVQGVTLQRLTDGLDSGIVLSRCWLKCVHADYARNRDNAFLFSSDMPARVCRDILHGRTESVLARPSSTTAPVLTTPTALQVSIFAIRAGTAKLRNALEARIFDEQWGLGLINRPIQSSLHQPAVEPKWILPMPRGRFLADPFIAEIDDTLVVLAEDYSGSEGRGRISAIAIDSKGQASPPVTAISEPHHLSYPFLVKRRGEWFCIPESAEAGEVRIYSHGNGLQDWKVAGTLLHGVALLDCTVVQFEEYWWMFACTRNGPTEARLEIYFSRDLFGPWQPHPVSPVKSDIRSSRPAGTPFLHEGSLYRPAQDCSRTYGGSVVIHRIETLTPADFSEREAVRLTPGRDWRFPHGMHTISGAGNWTVVDAKRRIVLPRAFASKFPINH